MKKKYFQKEIIDKPKALEHKLLQEEFLKICKEYSDKSCVVPHFLQYNGQTVKDEKVFIDLHTFTPDKTHLDFSVKKIVDLIIKK